MGWAEGDYRLRSSCRCCRLFAGKVTDNKRVCAPVGVWTPPAGGEGREVVGGESDEKATDGGEKGGREMENSWRMDGGMEEGC